MVNVPFVATTATAMSRTAVMTASASVSATIAAIKVTR